MSLIVIEGLDGAGSSTQCEMLIEYLKHKGKNVDFIHFPDYDEEYTGELISKYLRGEYGNINSDIPYYLYSMNRYLSKINLEQKIKNNHYVILDRYVTSSMVYQGIHMKNIKKEDFENSSIINKKIKSIYELMSNLEFEVFGLPIPRHEIYLDVPFYHIEHVNKARLNNNNREYLKGKKDIHESNLEYLKLVSRMYKYIFKNYKPENSIIKCYDENDKILSKESIHKQIKTVIFP